MKNRMKAFTLIEILIVVVILGILAAIVVPQFTANSATQYLSEQYVQLETLKSEKAALEKETTPNALRIEDTSKLIEVTEKKVQAAERGLSADELTRAKQLAEDTLAKRRNAQGR